MGKGHAITPTDPANVAITWHAHEAAFGQISLQAALKRVCAIVVQPGLDFGNEDVVHFDPTGATELSHAVLDLPGAVYQFSEKMCLSPFLGCERLRANSCRRAHMSVLPPRATSFFRGLSRLTSPTEVDFRRAACRKAVGFPADWTNPGPHGTRLADFCR